MSTTAAAPLQQQHHCITIITITITTITTIISSSTAAAAAAAAAAANLVVDEFPGELLSGCGPKGKPRAVASFPVDGAVLGAVFEADGSEGVGGNIRIFQLCGGKKHHFQRQNEGLGFRV